MLKNTNKEYSILQKNNKNINKIYGNIVVFSLATLLIGNVYGKTNNKAINNTDVTQISNDEESTSIVSREKETFDKEYLEGEARFSFFQQFYMESLKELESEKFDTNFEEICKSGKYSINGKEYSVMEVYIVKCDDGSIHLVKAGENKLDILTNTEFNSKKIIILQFSNSKVFYEMYESGVFNTSTITLTSEIFNKYAGMWNGEKHLETKTQRAEEKAHEEYQKKYGE